MTRLLRVGAAFVAISLLAMPARATSEDDGEGPAPTGVRFGARSGFAVPTGNAFVGSGLLSDTITGYFPLRLDVGARIADHFYVGARAELGVVVPNACTAAMQCSGTDLRVGFLAAAHLFPRSTIDPWIGAGAGFEQLSVTRRSFVAQTVTARGLELVDVELGLDLVPMRGLRFGPVVSQSLGRFTTVTLNGVDTQDFAATIHGWLEVGIRAAYDL